MFKILIILLLSVEMVHAFSKANNVKDCKDKAKGPCSEFNGRARLYNNKWIRIWKRGTNRLYQVASQTDSAFFELKHLSMATEIYADFDVCFLKPETPTGYSDICVSSVKMVKTSYMPE